MANLTREEQAEQIEMDPKKSGFEVLGHLVKVEFSDGFRSRELKYPVKNGALIGRMSKQCDVVISDRLVSRIQAKIYLEGGEIFFETISKTNASTVNKIPVHWNSDRVELQDGDEMEMGESKYIWKECVRRPIGEVKIRKKMETIGMRKAVEPGSSRIQQEMDTSLASNPSSVKSLRAKLCRRSASQSKEKSSEQEGHKISSVDKNSKTNLVDIETSPNGYRLIEAVCPWFKMNGECWKGEFCDLKHVQNAKGEKQSDLSLSQLRLKAEPSENSPMEALPSPRRSRGAERLETAPSTSSSMLEAAPSGTSPTSCRGVVRLEAAPSTKSHKGALRQVVVDGSNVGMAHGGHEQFSVRGISICVEYFTKLGHKTLVMMPKHRWTRASTKEREVLDSLEKSKVLFYTPGRNTPTGRSWFCHDDRFLVEYAARHGGVVLTNDNYKDLADEPTFSDTIENRLLPFMWVEDTLMIPNDPLGRNGPKLEQFLKK